ncbi:hypothetical protein BLTE_05610 [Blastochloris tepida]|uniref:Uncharacterized protein n=1 Tax=Blastochloris tepida TaxID=2233851 RepID=A0A348FX43_9HYPH|nr:hypothetical protein BLTE_05610 [Blastochloris tepida]
MAYQRFFDDLVPNALGRHHHQLSADQLQPFVLMEEADLHHALDLGNAEGSARQSGGGGGDGGMADRGVHGARLAETAPAVTAAAIRVSSTF